MSEPLDLRADEQIELAHRLGPQWRAFRKSWRRYTWPNSWYQISDGAVYYSMLTTLRPKRILEVGSGFTSAIALDVRDQELHDLELTFIDPNPGRLLGLLKDNDHAATKIYRKPVQEIPIEAFDVLEKNDILFIDSSHTSSSGGDVNLLFFDVLPRLREGVVVHIHDMFYPFEYPDGWLASRGFAWNELYFVRAFLSYNSTFQIMLFNSWLWREHPEVVERHFPESVDLRAHPEIAWRSLPASVNLSPASLWLRRVD
jgi:Methyltransferase domain